MTVTDTHVCTTEDCGWSCWVKDGVNVRAIRVSYGDAGVIDGEALCPCEDHDE